MAEDKVQPGYAYIRIHQTCESVPRPSDLRSGKSDYSARTREIRAWTHVDGHDMRIAWIERSGPHDVRISSADRKSSYTIPWCTVSQAFDDRR